MKRNQFIQTLIILIGLFLLNIQIAYPQQGHQLSGTVKSPYSNEPIKGAVITVPGVQEVAQTDSLGSFSLEIVSPQGTLEIWAPGYYTSKIPIMERSYIDVVLIPQDKFNYNETLLKPLEIDELQNKSTAITNLSKDNFVMGSTSIEQAIYNAFPGLRSVNKSGTPGEGAYMNSRGVRSFISNSAPLIVINGVPQMPDMSDSYIVSGYSNSVLNAINPNDVKNISYLKGSEATTYGSLGSNGVILIETENAADQQTRVQFTGQYGLATNNSTLPVFGTEDFKSYIGNIALTRYPDPADVLNQFPFLQDENNYYQSFLYNNNTDWQDKIYNTAFVTDNQLRVKGGDAIAVYDLSLGYFNQNGVVKNTDFTRYHARLNGNVNVSRKVDVFASMAMAYMTSTYQEQGMIRETNPLLAALAKSPLRNPYNKDQYGNVLPEFAPVKDANGIIYENDGVSNPLAIVKSTDMEGTSYDVLLSGGINYKINQDIKLTGLVGFYYNYNRSNVFIPGVDDKAIMPLSEGFANNTVKVGIKETHNFYYNINGSWNKKLDNVHNIKAKAGWQAMTTRREYDAGEGRNTASDYYQNLDNTNSSGRSFNGYINKWNWMNFFANADYNYNNLFYGGVSFSLDGSSSIGGDASRFHLYPSVNAGWNIKNMPWLIDSNLINRLTLRTEYVSTGNSSFSSMLSKYYFRTQQFQQLSGIVRAGIPNTKIEPEKTGTFNIGLDVSLLNNSIDLTLDVYTSTTSNVILDKYISSAFGSNVLYDNVVKIRNQGIEVGLQGYIIRTKDIKWLIGGTIAHNKNKIKSLGGESDKIIELADGSALISRKGESVYSFYGYKTAGVYASTSAAKEDGYTNYAGTPFGAGDIRFVDTDGDKVIDSEDRVILGNADPNIFGRFYTSVSYKGFTLTANFAYSQGNKAYNAVRRNSESMKNFDNQLESVNRRWVREGQITDMPRAVYGDPMNNSRFSDRWIEDASFVKLKELTLSYTFDKDFIKFLQGGTFYVSGENLATWTKYLGLDPEFSYNYNPMYQGFDYGKIAQPINVKFGVNLQF
ncbi:MAG: SusC/RagA family TonB-linked outer membrane protein [Dysgonomonas sp.]